MTSVAFLAMLLSDFDFHLPPELIAQEPILPRHDARLMVYNRAQDTVQHATVRDLPELIPPHSLVVANNSKVRKARLYARSESRNYEIVILEKIQDSLYSCLIGGKGLTRGTVLQFFTESNRIEAVPFTATVIAQNISKVMTTFQLLFTSEEYLIEAAFERYGHTPLPPYISRKDTKDAHYQTLFAKELGSAAAPTAGLHFTTELLQEIESAGHQWSEVTLHVGLGTFLPLRETDVTSNSLHTEMTYISDTLSKHLTHTNQTSQPIVAIGTTTTRTLESHHQNGAYLSGALSTNIFLYPGYVFNSVDCLFTNFHLPKSSLLLMVAAFIGNTRKGNVGMAESEMCEKIQKLYATAISKRYRFYSYGDAMLIL